MNPHKLHFIESFPTEYHEDVAFVYEKLAFEDDVRNSWLLKYNFEYLDKNLISHPFFSRCLIKDNLNLEQFSQLHQTIIDCFFTQHFDGFIREKHLKALDTSQSHLDIAMPFIMANVGDYVYEIQLVAINILINNFDATKDFISRNKEFWIIQQSRVAAIWDLHYRGVQPVPRQWKTFKDYPVRAKIIQLNRLLIEN